MWQIWIVFHVEGCGVSSIEHKVHLVGVSIEESFVVRIVGKMAQDVGMVSMCCGVIPISFGWFLRVPSLHVLVFLSKTFL